jgi:DNA-directed RNA polymerase specialized sigma24 family protein
LDDPDLLVGEGDPEHTIVSRLDWARKEHCFVNCMEHLSPEERRLIFEYYPNENRDLEERRRHLAVSLGIEAGTLATRMNRLRNRLERCCLSCYRRHSAGRRGK